MRVYLVQHGDAVAKEVDPERPLSDRGRDDVQRVTGLLSSAGLGVARIAHSGKLRAEQTANLLALTLGGGKATETRDGLGPNDPSAPVADALAAEPQDVMLVGHLPFMARLATRLVTGAEDPAMVAFTPGSVVCLEQADDGRFAIAWMVRPELIAGD